MNKTYMQIIRTMRWAFGTALCGLIYKEAGIFTALAIFLIGANAELMVKAFNKHIGRE